MQCQSVNKTFALIVSKHLLSGVNMQFTCIQIYFCKNFALCVSQDLFY